MAFRIEHLPRWCWMILGVIAGGIIAAQYHPPDLHAAMDHLEDQRRFESLLFKTDSAGPRFCDVVVHPAEFDTRKRQTVYPITGRYRFDPASAPHAIRYDAPQPYQPITDLSRLVASNQGMPSVSTIDQLLALAQRSSGVTWKYAWWEAPGVRPIIHLSIGALLIGGVWPTLINLIVFRSLKRPASAPATSLWNVRAHAAPPPRAGNPVDLKVIEALDAELEAALAASPDSPAAPPPPPPRTEIKTLSPVPPASAPPLAEKDAIDYAAKPDDFYPTARQHAKEQS